MTDAVFDAAVATVLEHEGDYVCDPLDPGGETRWGISRRQYPDLDIAGLTREKAAAIYYTDYYLRYRIGQLPGVSLPVKVFDTLVNVGPVAIRLLQIALRDCGVAVDVDGKIGPATSVACKSVDGTALLEAYRKRIAEHYEGLVAKNPTLARFATGWRNRAMA